MPAMGFEPTISTGERPQALCDELITRPEESYRLCCVVVCDLETSRMGAPYIYYTSRLRVNETYIWLNCMLSYVYANILYIYLLFIEGQYQ